MPIVKSDVLPLLEAGLRTDFFKAYRQLADNSTVAQIATTVKTTLPSQKYGWLGAMPLMREFVDERLPGGLRGFTYTINDKVWESSLSVDRRALEDDQYDMIRMRVQDLAREAVRHREFLVVQALLDGSVTGTCYDGQLLFDTDHAEGESGLQSNRLSGTLSTGNLQAAIAQMMTIKNDRGIPMGIMPDTLLVGPKLQWLAMEILESAIVVQTNTTNHYTPYRNVMQGRLRLIVSPYIAGTFENYWYLLDTGRAVRAIILQERSDVPIEFTALDSPTGENVFMRDRVLYGIRARYGVGYGLWQTAFAGVA